MTVAVSRPRQGSRWVAEDPMVRFTRMVERTPTCWLWTGALDGSGYGRFWDGRRYVGAHRFLFERVSGPLPAGLEPDHLCRQRRCVRPTHMEAVTHAENVRRGESFAGRHARKTHCPAGHPYSRVDGRGQRVCDPCARDRARRSYDRRNHKEDPGADPDQD